MALPAYLSLVGQSQGRIAGSVIQRGREGKILVIGGYHRIAVPRDPASGAPTGKRVHKPFTILKLVDRASPSLYLALTSNEALSSWDLQFFRPSPDGTEKNFYTVTLEDATVSGIQLRLPNTRDKRLARLDPYEEVHFSYRRIVWKNLDGNNHGSDDWDTPLG